MNDPRGRRQAVHPEAVFRLDILSSSRPEHRLRVEQQISAVSALLKRVARGSR